MGDQHAFGRRPSPRRRPRSGSCGRARRARPRSARGPCRRGRRTARAVPWKRAAFSAKRGPKRSSSGSTLCASACFHHSAIIASSRSGSCRARSLGLREIAIEMVELPGVVLERRARADGTPPPSSRPARARGGRTSRNIAAAPSTARRRRGGSAAKLTPSIGCCAHAGDRPRARSTPTTSSRVGTRSLAWQNCCRSSPRAAMPFGQDITSGSRMPPPWVFCL